MDVVVSGIGDLLKKFDKHFVKTSNTFFEAYRKSVNLALISIVHGLSRSNINITGNDLSKNRVFNDFSIKVYEKFKGEDKNKLLENWNKVLNNNESFKISKDNFSNYELELVTLITKVRVNKNECYHIGNLVFEKDIIKDINFIKQYNQLFGEAVFLFLIEGIENNHAVKNSFDILSESVKLSKINDIICAINNIKLETQVIKNEINNIKLETNAIKNEINNIKLETNAIKHKINSIKLEANIIKNEINNIKLEINSTEFRIIALLLGLSLLFEVVLALKIS